MIEGRQLVYNVDESLRLIEIMLDCMVLSKSTSRLKIRSSLLLAFLFAFGPHTQRLGLTSQLQCLGD